MTTFNDRERAFEAKFAHDEEMLFRITARRNRLVGEWAARLMNLTPEETDEEAGDEDVVGKVLGDLTSAGIDTDEAAVRAALTEKAIEAKRQIMSESK
jgi:hypothetical protein